MTPLTWRLVIVGLGTILIPLPSARSEGPTRQEMIKAAKAASAFVRVGSASGSAFCVHPSGLFATSQHLVGAAAEVKLVLHPNTADQRAVKAKVVRIDVAADLALLQVDGLSKLPFLRIGGDDKLTEGDDVVACGFPFGERLALSRDEYPAITITFGKVTSLRQRLGELEMIQVDVDLHPGNSGGPVLGADGRVVGMVLGGVKDTKFRFAVPARRLHRFLDNLAVTFKAPEPTAANWKKPVAFEVRAISALPAENPLDVKLILRTPEGKEVSHLMKPDHDNYRIEVALPPVGGPTPRVHCTIVISRDGKELARLNDWIVNEGTLHRAYLADLPEAKFEKGPWDLGRGVTGNPDPTSIQVGGMKFPKGLGTHPICSVTYNLRKAAMLFRTKTAIDDSSSPRRTSSVTFEVVGDGKVLWTSKPITRIGQTDDCLVDVHDINMLELRTTVDGNNYGCAAVWLDPYVLTNAVLVRPEPEVTVADKDRTVYAMPDAISDAALGGGGHFLIVCMSKARKLAVFDVTQKEKPRLIDLDQSGPARVVAGADQLLVFYPEAKTIVRYSLEALKKETSIDSPFEGTVSDLALGSASHGPLFLVGEKPPLDGAVEFIDVQRMRKLKVKYNAKFGGVHTGPGTTALASADGRTFGLGAANAFSSGFQTVLFQGATAETAVNPNRLLYAWPAPDGNLVFTSSGLFTKVLDDPSGAPQRGNICLPAAHGDFYLKVNVDSISLCLLGTDEPLRKLNGIGWSREILRDQVLHYFRHVFLIPRANLIVTIPAGSKEVWFNRFAIDSVPEKVSGNYLFVMPYAAPIAKKGKAFSHELHALSRKGGVTYRVLAAPSGMSISKAGTLSWDVPKDFPDGVHEVQIEVQDAAGSRRLHSFSLRVE